MSGGYACTCWQAGGIFSKRMVRPSDCPTHGLRSLNRRLLHASDLRTLAQYLLAGAAQLQRGELSPEASQQLSAWVEASDHIKALVHEGPQTMAAMTAKRAAGMLLRGHVAQDAAIDAIATELRDNESLHNALADGAWDAVAHSLVTIAITEYHANLEAGQA